jgi:hypothetical protein
MRFLNDLLIACALLLAALSCAPTSSRAQTGAPTATAAAHASLGDLSAFRAIADDTLKIVGSGDLAAAKTRIRDLEKTWDDAEATMRPRDKDKWRRVDRAIDKALAELRADNPMAQACADALHQLILVMDDVSNERG